MKRRILALVLALVMAVGLALPASAEGLDGATTIGGDGAPVVITGDGVTTTPPTPGDSTPTPGDSTPTPGDSTPTPGDSTPTPGDSTPAPLGMAPLDGDAPVVAAENTTATNVKYLDKNGNEQTCPTATVVKASAEKVTWGAEGTNTWYVVNGSVEINNTVYVYGNVNLILADGKTLTVKGKPTALRGDAPCGIIVGGNLTIYAQSADTNVGKLVVTADEVGDDRSIGITIALNRSLTVNGGVITATGGAVNKIKGNHEYYSCGINAEGDMTINGGTVTATGGDVQSKNNVKSYSYGLSIYSTVTVNGGKLTATGGDKNATDSEYPSTEMHSYGIYCRGTLNVKGGEVEATGGTASDKTSNGSNGICMRKYGDIEPKLTIDGGKLTATGGTGSSFNFGISIYDGNTKPEVTLTSGTLIAKGTGTSGNAFFYMVNSFTHITAPATYYLRTAADGEYTKYITADNTYTFPQSGGYVELTTIPSGDGYIPYKNWNSTRLVDAAIADTDEARTVVTDSTTTWTGGATADEAKWYVVKNNVTITSAVTVTGHVNLILCDGKTLTVEKGVAIGDPNSTEGDRSSLTIYGQTAQSGTLTVEGGTDTTVGIDVYLSSLTINGGNINATGGSKASYVSYGISINYNNSSMTVNSGNVTAIGRKNGSNSIGINLENENPTLTVNGGKVTAKGKDYGINNNRGTVTIKGGTVIAQRGSNNKRKAVRNNATLTLPTVFWWRASNEEGMKYNTQNTYTDSALAGTYFEMTTTQPAGSIEVDQEISYVDANGEGKACADYIVLRDNSGDVTLDSGWYVVNSDVTIDGTLTINGKVHLILCNDATLTVNKGVVVDGSGEGATNNKELTIYGQSGQTGKLVANGTANANGCFGISSPGYGDLTINGGIIAANGANDSRSTASTGEAEGDADPMEGVVNQSYGIHAMYLVINGGKVIAKGGKAVGVSDPNGDGSAYSGGIFVVGEMEVNGGEVNATGGTAEGKSGQSFGIRASELSVGKSEEGSLLKSARAAAEPSTSSGAVVNATGGAATMSFGIDSGSELTISDGEVTATGGAATGSVAMSCGICAEELAITGGEVNATGSTATNNTAETGSAMSLGIYAGNVTIGDGEVTATGGTATVDKGTAMSVGIEASNMFVGNMPAVGYAEDDTPSTTTGAVVNATGGAAGELSYGIAVGSLNNRGMLYINGSTVNATGGVAERSIGLNALMTFASDGAKLSANGGSSTETFTVEESYGIWSMLLWMGNLGESGGDDALNSLLALADEDAESSTTSGDAEVTAKGGTAKEVSCGIEIVDFEIDMYGLGEYIPPVRLNGGKLTAIGTNYGINVTNWGDDAAAYALDDDSNEDTGASAGTVTIVKGTLIADATGTGHGLDLDKGNGESYSLVCPEAYWWRINKAVNGYRQFPGNAYVHNDLNDYVEITTEGEGLPLLPDSEPTTTHKHIRRQNTAVADLIPTPGKTDVASPETFDAGITVYAVMGAVSAAASAAWIGKRRKR